MSTFLFSRINTSDPHLRENFERYIKNDQAINLMHDKSIQASKKHDTSIIVIKKSMIQVKKTNRLVGLIKIRYPHKMELVLGYTAT